MTLQQKFNEYIASGDPIIGISDEQRDWILPFIERCVGEERNPYVKVIVDLYEIRHKVNRPRGFREVEPIEDIFQWNFLNSLIAQLSDKYEVKGQDIKGEMQRRNLEGAVLNSLTQEDKIK